MPLQNNFLGLPLSETAVAAAIVGAVLGGVFSLFKEGFAFVLRLLERRGEAKRQRRAIYGRLAHYYYQMGVGAWKSLQAWSQAIEDIRAYAARAGLADEGPSVAPDMGFLSSYDDPRLATEVLQLADQDPDAVTAYIHVATLRRRVPNLCAEEQEEFASVRFSYPRTRKQLLTLMEYAARFERAAARHCQSQIFYGLRLGVRETLEDGATKIAEALATFTKPTAPDIFAETEDARQRVQGAAEAKKTELLTTVANIGKALADLAEAMKIEAQKKKNG